MAKTNATLWGGIRRQHLSYVLELLASMLYIIAAIFFFSAFANGSLGNSLFILASNAFWLPVAYAFAIAGTAILFVVSFTNLMHKGNRSDMSYRYPMVTSLVTGISWLALSGGNIFLTLLVIIAFVLSIIGSAIGMVTA